MEYTWVRQGRNHILKILSVDFISRHNLVSSIHLGEHCSNSGNQKGDQILKRKANLGVMRYCCILVLEMSILNHCFRDLELYARSLSLTY